VNAANRTRPQSGSSHLLNRVQWILFVLAALLAAIYLAWLALAQVNFLYPLWHDLIDVDHTIDTYAPQNRYRRAFELTSKTERSRLFAAIVDATHNQGNGLQKLIYHDTAGNPLGKLLREPEIVHLQDVARLIDRLRPVGLVASLATIALLVAIRWQRLSMPSITSLLLGVVSPLSAVAAAVLLIGPVEVFYWLHTLIFPAGYKWFFYYQDSLMSTMMKAPDMFGYIALAWAMLSLLVLAGFLTVTRYLTSDLKQKYRRPLK
jgi:hypothetical protein